MKIKANAIRLQYTETGQAEIILTTQNNFSLKRDVAESKGIIAKGKELSVEVKEYRHKRSLDANSYAWVLISKIADALRSSKEEVYIEMLKRYGQAEKQLISVIAEAGDIIKRATNNHCMEVGESQTNGKLFKHFRILIGSSQYDSLAMAKLIDGIISECQELNIETLTENEKREMLSKWGNAA